MTAQEKANDLIRFFDSIQFDHNKNIAYTFNHFTIEEKKRCAINVVDEIINEIDNYECGYWAEVKKQMQLL
jgi:hypothetical protein